MGVSNVCGWDITWAVLSCSSAAFQLLFNSAIFHVGLATERKPVIVVCSRMRAVHRTQRSKLHNRNDRVERGWTNLKRQVLHSWGPERRWMQTQQSTRLFDNGHSCWISQYMQDCCHVLGYSTHTFTYWHHCGVMHECHQCVLQSTEYSESNLKI